MRLCGSLHDYLSPVNQTQSGKSLNEQSQVPSCGAFSQELRRAQLNLLHEDGQSIHEKCGVFAVFRPEGKNLGGIFSKALNRIQHRGQEAAGIAYSNDHELQAYTGLGLVNDVITESVAKLASGRFGIGHTLYATSKEGSKIYPQPVVAGSKHSIALAHNGNLPDFTKLKNFLREKNINIEGSDSTLMARAIAYYADQGLALEQACVQASSLFEGTYSLLVMNKDKLVAMRDPYGIRPFSLGELEDGSIVLASESAAFKPIQGKLIRDVYPGEILVIDRNSNPAEIKNRKPVFFAQPNPKIDAFEYIYFARPDSIIWGKTVNTVRRQSGINLAQEFKAKYPHINIDVVVPVPESGIAAAFGVAEALGKPVERALIKNRHRRTFIDGGQGVSDKFSTVDEALAGKSIALVDDSIVRGNTSKKIVEMLKKTGAREVHFLSASPPIRFPDFYGIDTPAQSELIAAYDKEKGFGPRSEAEIARDISADSLCYLSVDGLVQAIGLPRQYINLSAFTGEYPCAIGSRDASLDHFNGSNHGGLINSLWHGARGFLGKLLAA